MNALEKENIQSYLTHLAKAQKLINKLGCNGTVELYPGYYEVHVYRGIKAFAEAVGAKLDNVPRDDSDFPAEQEFYYQDIRFFQLIKRDS